MKAVPDRRTSSKIPVDPIKLGTVMVVQFLVGSIANVINMWIVADNIRKGAATNAVQIARVLTDNYL